MHKHGALAVKVLAAEADFFTLSHDGTLMIGLSPDLNRFFEELEKQIMSDMPVPTEMAFSIAGMGNTLSQKGETIAEWRFYFAKPMAQRIERPSTPSLS